MEDLDRDESDSPERVLCPDESCIGILDDAGKCPECGAVADMPEAQAPSEPDPGFHDADSPRETFDPERELCPDGTCIGVVGSDGRCKECRKPGRSSALDPRQRAKLTDDELEDLGREELAAHSSTGNGFDGRELCIDGGCIGLIGPDGHCKECGKEPRAAC